MLRAEASRVDVVRRRRALLAVAALGALGASSLVAPSIVMFAFTPLAVLAGWMTMRRWPGLYVQLCLWIVFLSPFLRRMVDYEIGYRAANPILLAPLLVPALTVLPLLARLPQLRSRAYAPYGLALVGVMCGFVIGAIKLGLLGAGYGLATWLVPLSFGFYIAHRWRDYAEVRHAITQTFVVSLLLLGAYGIWQFISPLPWDVYWIVSGGQSVSLDFRPYHLRIFGTLNSFAPYAGVLLSGLIVALSSDAPLLLRIPAGIIGVVALLMSQVRTCWAGLVIAIVLLIILSPWQRGLRLIPLLALPLAIVPFVLASSSSGVLRRRVESFNSLENDGSYLERQAYRSAAWDAIATTPEGSGTGSTGMAWVLNATGPYILVEQGFQDAFYSLGWLGGAAYLAGVLALVWRTLVGGAPRDDRLALACRCAALAIFAASLVGNVFVAVAGTLFWSFVGMHTSAYANSSPRPIGSS